MVEHKVEFRRFKDVGKSILLKEAGIDMILKGLLEFIFLGSHIVLH